MRNDVQTNLMDCLPTHKLSQDILESFFGRIRSFLGYNDNPTVEQFTSAFRKVLINDEIKCSDQSNCRDSLCLDILGISSRRSNLNTVDSEHSLNAHANYEGCANPNEQIETNHCELKELESVSVAHIAGIIEKKIDEQGRSHCADCIRIFSENDKIAQLSQSHLTRIPCQSTFDICSIAHKHVKKLVTDSSYTYGSLLSDVSREFNNTTAYSKTNFEGHEDHKTYFITFIAEEYIRIQATYIAKKVTLQEQEILLGNKAKKMRQLKGK